MNSSLQRRHTITIGSQSLEQTRSRNFGSPTTYMFLVFRWTYWRQMSQLHQDTQIIAYRPTLNDFAVGESEHLHSGGSNSPAGRWLPHVTARVRCGGRVATHDRIAFRNHRFYLNAQ